MRGLEANDSRAAELVFRRFSEQLIALARKKLNWKLRRKLDPEEVMQSALRSFFRMQAQGAVAFHNWDALWGLLHMITLRKCGHQIRHYRAACRDIDREMPHQSDDHDGDSARADWEAVSREPSPEQAAIMVETVEELLRPLNERDQQIARLALQGCTAPEISLEIGRSVRTVTRVLNRLADDLLRTIETPDVA
jgi:RNA polymerase sigma factor (sigma-70 family)